MLALFNKNYFRISSLPQKRQHVAKKAPDYSLGVFLKGGKRPNPLSPLLGTFLCTFPDDRLNI